MRRTQDNYNISGVCRMTQYPIQPAVAQNRRPQRKSLDTKVKQIFFTDISFSLSLITMLCLTVQFLNPSSQFFATLKLTKTDWENIFQKKTSIMTNAAVEPARGGCSIQLMSNSIFTFLHFCSLGRLSFPQFILLLFLLKKMASIWPPAFAATIHTKTCR